MYCCNNVQSKTPEARNSQYTVIKTYEYKSIVDIFTP